MASAGPASEAAEKTIARVFVASRFAQMAFAGLMLSADAKRFSKPRAQVALFGLAAVESVWLCSRVLRAGRYRDRRGLWVDTVFTSVGLLACEAALGDGEGSPWMKNLTIGASLGAAAAPTPAEGVAAMGVLSGAAVVAGLRARGNDSHVAGVALAVNDAISWSGMHGATGIYLRAHRRYAALRDRADDVAVARASEAASDTERSRQHRRLHRRTVDVLEELARTDNEESAGALARREAARLRHALRTGGSGPAGGLDEALFEVAQSIDEHGVRVELVTRELSHEVGDESCTVLRDAVHQTLLAAVEFGGASRAVVRAADSADSVHVTVRDHGAGFVPGEHGAYESDLEMLDGLLREVGGRAELWSAPGRGVRVSLEVGVERRTDHPADQLPGGEPRSRADADGDAFRTDDDLDGPRRPRRLRAAEDELGPIADELGARGRRQPFEARVQERDRRDDLDSGRGGHSYTVTAVTKPARGSSPPFASARERADPFVPLTAALLPMTGGDERLRAERTLMAAFLTWRASGLATGLSAVLTGRDEFRHRGVAVAQLGGATAESVWLAVRLFGQDRWSDRTGSMVEIGAAIATLAVGRTNLDPVHRGTWFNWAPWSFAANAVCGQAMGTDRSDVAAAGASAIIAAMVLPGPAIGDVVANTFALGSFFVCSRFLANQIRRDASRTEQARAEAMAEGARLASEHERLVQLRVLHDSALQALESIGTGRFADVPSVRSVVLAEADRLRQELGANAPDVDRTDETDLHDALESLVEGIPLRLTADLRFHEAPAVSRPVTLALVQACGEALNNVVKHAGTDRVTITVAPVHGGVQVVIADRGRGFDTAAVRPGFGITSSITSRLQDVRGRSSIESTPGAGTTVTLWGPA